MPETPFNVKAPEDFFRKKLEILHWVSVFKPADGIYIPMEQLTCKVCGKEVSATFRGMCMECCEEWIEEQEQE